MLRFKFFFLVVGISFAIQFTPNWVRAQYFTGPVVTGAGGAGRASVDPLEGAFMNPASLSQLSHYYFGTFYTDSVDVTKNRRRDFSLMVADSTPDKIWPMALAYTQRRITDPGTTPVDQKDYYIAIADYITSRLSMGVGFHRLESEIGGEDFNQHNAHLGLLFVPTPNLGLAAVLYDITHAGSDVPSRIKLRQTLGLGLNYVVLDFVRFRLDWTMPTRKNPDNDSRLHFGVESETFDLMTFRAGAQWDDVERQTFVSAGFSFTGPRLVVGYAFEKEVQPSDGGQRHLFDLSIFF